MASQIGSIGRHGDIVTDAGCDLTMTSRAHIRLGRLVRLHASNLDGSEATVPQSRCHPNTAQASSATMATTAIPTIK